MFDTSFDWTYEVRRIIEAARANVIPAGDLAACSARSIETLDACLGLCDSKSDLDRALVRAIDGAIAKIRRGTDETKGTAGYVELLENSKSELASGRMRWGAWAKLTSEEPKQKSVAFAQPVKEAARRHIEHPRLRADMHRLVELMFRVAADGLTAFQGHKRERGVLDFVDQETLALDLLRREDVRTELRGQIDLVLVDEFQDTSPIQLAVFLELAALARESVWVGDPKQAIFGFRGTDPALMDAAIESLTSSTNDPDLVAEAARAVSRGKVETLSVSYRSRPELVALTSEIFARAFAHQGIPEERTRLEPALTREPGGLGPAFGFWPLTGKNKALRAAAVASAARDHLAAGSLVRDRQTGAARPLGPADLAILCRTNEQCALVAEALGALGIPAVVPRVGLLDTAEGRLACAALRLWVDPGDALAAAEVARIVSYPEALDALVTRALESRDAFRDDPAVDRILRARAARPDLAPLAAVDAVIDGCELRALCAAWGHAPQRLANLDALRGHAAAYVAEAQAAGDAATVSGLLRHLDDLVDDFGWDKSRADSQALLAGAEAVTLSTWHRAKGLEWPVVVLYGLEDLRDPMAHGAHVMSDRDAFDVADPLGGRWIRFWPNPYSNAQQRGPVRTAFESSPAYADLVRRADREALRVLYVGWTRARDQLVLAAQRGRLLGGLLGKLAELDPSLVSEPPASAPGTEPAVWAGQRVVLAVRPAEAAAPVDVHPAPGTVTVGRAPSDFVPAVAPPSAMAPVACGLGDIVDLGPRIALRAGCEMQWAGQAVHSFLAADRPGLAPDDRLALASELLSRHDVAAYLVPADVVTCADRLWRWIDDRFPAARLHREWPVAMRLPSDTVVAGAADLVIATATGYAVIDHKTFPGVDEAALDRALAFSGQLAAYAGAIGAATAAPITSLWIHFPILGRLVELRPARPQSIPSSTSDLGGS